MAEKLKITSKDSHHIDWLLEKPNHGLEENGLSAVVKILISKHNDLVEFTELQSRQIKNLQAKLNRN